MNRHQERVFQLFQAGVVTLEQVKRSGPYWAAAIDWLVNRGLVERLPDWKYGLTLKGEKVLSLL